MVTFTFVDAQVKDVAVENDKSLMHDFVGLPRKRGSLYP